MENTNLLRIAEVQTKIKNGQASLKDLVQHHLDQIEAKKNLNVFLTVYAEEALAQAEIVDAKIKAGTAGKLAGLILGIKDLLVYKDHPSRASSKILGDFNSQFTATGVQRALDEDAIIIGTQNCDEFGMGTSNENSAFGPVLNADDPTRVAGGSSGGSAVAVQAGMCMASLGTDTGGSVRQPAAFCGIYGLKPTYGRISRFGLIAYASSFDCIGIFAQNPEDVALILEVIAGQDQNDNTSSDVKPIKYTGELDKELGNLKIAYLEDVLDHPSLHEDVKESYKSEIDKLGAQGHTLKGLTMDLLEYALPTYYVLTTAEASSNLSRFDGVRYGFRDPAAETLEEMYKNSRSKGFGPEVKRRIMLGTFVLSSSYYDAYYTRAQKTRRLIKEYLEGVLSEYDLILIPTTPSVAFKIGEKIDDPMSMYLADIFTVPASIAGLPALSYPMARDDSGMAIGLQVIAKPFEEGKLLAFAKQRTKN